tara:strand:- start:257 stop:1465 length:1209 start_codon:yes stop_codon:yes gene_type:complete
MSYKIQKIREDFPIFNNQKIIYFDNASTTQKPQSVIDSITNFYTNYNANVHRGTYQIAESATKKYELARNKIANFINANNDEIIFTKSTTESINLIAYSLGINNYIDGDEIIISEMEHHSNIVPWQIISKKFNIKIKYIPLLNDGTLDINSLSKLITPRTKLLSITHMSNVLGTRNPIEDIIAIAKKNNIDILIDGAQSISHISIDVKKINCDYFVFSGHKIMGPTGIGVLYGKKQKLNRLNPFLGGGHMINEVSMNDFSFNDTPWKFEAGTPNIAQAIGLGEAIKYYTQNIDEKAHHYTKNLFNYLVQKLNSIPEITLYPNKISTNGPVISFTVNKIHAYDIAKLLDTFGICIRAGHHCAQPILDKYKVKSVNRISLYFYNTKEEIDVFYNCLLKVLKILS